MWRRPDNVHGFVLDSRSYRPGWDTTQTPSEFQVIMAHQATRPLTISESSCRRHDPPYVSLRKPSSDAPSRIPHPTGPERKFLLEGRLHCHLQPGRCRSSSPSAIRTHAASQDVGPLARSGSRPYVPAVQGRAKNTGTLATEMPEPRCSPTTFVWEAFAPTWSPHDRPREGAVSR